MGDNKQTMPEFWELETDDLDMVANEDEMVKYMREVQAAYDARPKEIMKLPDGFLN
jgi:hypothetical protein